MGLFNEYIYTLKSMVLKDDVFIPENFLGILYELSERSMFINFLENILENDEYIDIVASQSYQHQNGFDKLILYTDSDYDWRLRVHIWEPELYNSTKIGYDIHNHSFDFTSTIITGSLINEIYQVTKNEGDCYFKHIYQINNKTYEAQLRDLEEVKLLLEDKLVLEARDVYFQKKEKLHRIFSNSNKIAVTLVLQQINQQNFSNVFKKSRETYSKKIGLTGQVMNAQQVRNKIDSILTKL